MKLLKTLILTATTTIPLIGLIACSNSESEVSAGESYDVYFIETPNNTYRLQYRVWGDWLRERVGKELNTLAQYEHEYTSVRIKNTKTGKVLEFPFTEINKFDSKFNKSLELDWGRTIDYLMFNLTDIQPGTYQTDKVVWRSPMYDKTIYLKPEKRIIFEIKK